MKTQAELATLTKIGYQRAQLKIYRREIQAQKDIIFAQSQVLYSLEEKASNLARTIDSQERQLFESAELIKKVAIKVPTLTTPSKAQKFFTNLSEASGLSESEVIEMLREELRT